MNSLTDFARFITKFFNQHLSREKNLSGNTILSYGRTFSAFLKYAKQEFGIDPDKFELKDFTREAVLSFLDHLESENGNSISTRNQRLSPFLTFANFLMAEKPEDMVQWQRIKRIALKKGGKRDGINHLSKEETKAMMGSLRTDTKEGVRSLAVLVALYGLALRVQECADLTVGSLSIKHKPYTATVVGKGGKCRVIPIFENDKAILESYLQAYGLDSPEMADRPLFTNKRGEKLTRAGIAYILDQIIRNAKALHPDMFQKKITCHSLRHSRAMHMVEGDANIIYIRDFLGHASVTTTEIYAKANSKAKREALEKATEGIVPKQNDSDRRWEHDKGLLEWLVNLGKK